MSPSAPLTGSMTTGVVCWRSWAANRCCGRKLPIKLSITPPKKDIGSNGRLLRPEVADRLGDAGAAILNFALDAWDEKPSLPKAFVPGQKNLEYLIRKQYVYGYMVFFNINICRNNHDDARKLTEYAHAHRLATDYHINETPMLEQDEHFKHLSENPTYIRPEDWRAVDDLIDWIIEKNKAGYQMVNSVQRLQEMKAFVRMSSGLDLKKYGWYGDGASTSGNVAEMLARTPGIAQNENGELHFTDWNCLQRSEQRHHPNRWHRRAVFPHVSLNIRLGKYRPSKVRPETAQRDEAHLSAALLLHSESQPWLLLQRCASQMGLDPGRHEPHEGRGEKFRGLSCH